MSHFKDAQSARIRLHARHTGEPLTRDLIDMFLEELYMRESDIHVAYAEGLADRKSGARCLCPRCELDFKRITGNEDLRTRYSLKRRDELRTHGLAESTIDRRIDEEIRAGAALRGSTHQ